MVFTTDQSAKFEALYKETAAVKDDLKIVQLVDKMLELLVAADEAQVKNFGVTRVMPHKQVALGR